MAAAPIIVVRLRIRGRVQGVGFRWAMVQQAHRLGVTGWVRNRHDDSVEAVVAGPAESVERMVAWARKGPPSAAVASVDVTADAGQFDDFIQRPTA
jgi:acylphosphatase